MFFDESDGEKKTQESYLGYDMDDAVKCSEEGRWPSGCEELSNILNKSGNIISTEDVLHLQRTNYSVYSKISKMFYAARTCRPSPGKIGGGCQAATLGRQTFSKGFGGGRSFFRRTAGNIPVCSVCPAGKPSQKEQTSYREKSLGMDLEKPGTIMLKDSFNLKIKKKTGFHNKFEIELTKDGHRLNYNEPHDMERHQINNALLSIEIAGYNIEKNENEEWFHYISPLISNFHQEQYSLDIEPQYEVKIIPFYNKKIRWFLGQLSSGNSIQKFIERNSGGSAHQQQIRIKDGESLWIWLPTSSEGQEEGSSWKERFGTTHTSRAEDILSKYGDRRTIQFEILDKYPGVFLFLKEQSLITSGGAGSIWNFLQKYSKHLHHHNVIPRFAIDPGPLRFFWEKEHTTNQEFDSGSQIVLRLKEGNLLNLLIQTQKSDGGNFSEDSVVLTQYPSIKVVVWEPSSKTDYNRIDATISPDMNGFAWSGFILPKNGVYQIGFANTSTGTIRSITVIVENSSEKELGYFGNNFKFEEFNSKTPWGTPNIDVRKKLIGDNCDSLVEGFENLESFLKIEEGESVTKGRILEIMRIVYSKFSKILPGHSIKSIAPNTLTMKTRSVAYALEHLFDLEISEEINDLLSLCGESGEFRYMPREDDLDSTYRLIPRGSFYSKIPANESNIILFDYRPLTELAEKIGEGEVIVDWQTGLRIIKKKVKDDLGESREIIFHPKELEIAKLPDQWLINYWNSVKGFSKEMPILEGEIEYRLKLDKSSPNKSRLPFSWYATKEITNSLMSYYPPNIWLKRNRWNEADSVEIGEQQRLFISIRRPIKDLASGEAAYWDLLLGCLDYREMSEKYISLLSSSSSSPIEFPWIDKVGNIGDMKLSWLADPKNGLYDGAYISRETIRSFASIVSGGEVSSLKGVGVPGWSLYGTRVQGGNDNNLVEQRAEAIIRLTGEIMNVSELQQLLTRLIASRYWWGLTDEN
jgi:hypothetical protein